MNEKMQKPKNARFWWMHPCTCEWVRITLKPGEAMDWHHFQYTDEGFSETHVGFRYCEWNPPVVKVEYFHRDRDCDGLHHSGSEVICTIDRLQEEERFACSTEVDSLIKIPDWKSLPEYQRDFTAESAGY